MMPMERDNDRAALASASAIQGGVGPDTRGLSEVEIAHARRVAEISAEALARYDRGAVDDRSGLTAAQRCQYPDMAPTGRMFPGGCAGLGERRFRNLVFWQEPHSALKSRRPCCRSCVMPSIVPDGQEPTVYLVLNDFGRYGRAYSETSEERADLETTIADLMTGLRPTGRLAYKPLKDGRPTSRKTSRAKSCAALMLPAMICRAAIEALSISTLARIASSPCGWRSPNYLGDIFGISAHFQARQRFDIAWGGPLCRRLRTQLGHRARSEKCQRTKSLRSSPLRGSKSREAGSRSRGRDGEVARSTRSAHVLSACNA